MPNPPRDNQADLTLFYRDPHGFLLQYQDTLRIIVKVYIQCGMFRARDLEDILQTLNEALLRRLPTIQARFKGSTFLSTYMAAVVRNVCIDLFHAGKRAPNVFPLDEAISHPRPDVTSLYDIEHSRRVFRAILKQFDYKLELPRLLFCLKLRYRIPIERADVLAWYPACSNKELTGRLKTLEGNYDNLTNKEISEIITPLLNRADGRSNTPEAIRRWTKERIDHIIELLNGSPPTASFDEETLEILVEDYFSPFLAQIQ